VALSHKAKFKRFDADRRRDSQRNSDW